ncbi:DUF4132 domain-containing protein [Klebsiella sp. RHBSTW-00484]|uniref:DUF4132 domain-containing protein n=1 Tax=unclassified Klebsiella TaxID=2608929 RepID=UPI0015E5819E|nr:MULTISPECIES: DUF4132 domain-containing protein [unclassified Klebsiella]QLO36187.1 DUF4132 domain-containing protein [Klebsiella sp. RHBSTW-00484]QLT75704.1 DUF4132 domain-containing protein [Klebsiella sp. RHBSTW-00464]
MHNAVTPPWLADDAQLELTFKKGKEPLSHRRWPGEPVPRVEEGRIQALANDLQQRFGNTQPTTFHYGECDEQWQQAIEQAISYINAPKPAMPARVIAVLVELSDSHHAEYLDAIVQQEGLEYATEVVIERQKIGIQYDTSNVWRSTNTVTFSPFARQYVWRSCTYHEFDIRLRKHFSLAEEELWQHCTNKLIAALPDIPPDRRPLMAILLPERADIATKMATQPSSSTEWLKTVITVVPGTLVKLRKMDVFNNHETSDAWYENHYGYAACAALLREQGLTAVSRLAPYAHGDDCAGLLAQIDHPQAVTLLLHVADKNQRSMARVNKCAKLFPQATLAALAELLAQKNVAGHLGWLNKWGDEPDLQERESRQPKLEAIWQSLLQVLLTAQPSMVEQILPWLTPQAAALLQLRSEEQTSAPLLTTDNASLPEILLSPPWRGKKKKAASPRFELPVLQVAPQEYWQPGEREALATSKPACFFNDLPLSERLTRKGEVVLRELGFEDMDYLFHQYTLNGQSGHLWSGYSAYGNEKRWYKAAVKALHSGESEVLLQAWRDYLEGGYNPNEHWNLYLLMQLPREQAVTLWQRINEENFKFVGAEYLLSILGTDALPGLQLALQHRPKEIFPLLIHIGATELALPVARLWRRFQAQSNLARQWLLQWPEHAATALIPQAFDKAGDNREAAINALRLLYQQGHEALLQTVALRWNEPQLWAALELLLTQDPLDNYPARTSKASDFWQPALWRRPRLISNDQPLTDDALEILGEMLRFAQGGHHYCGLDIVKATCQPQSLAAFAWDLFNAWQNAGAPAKENWAFQILGLFGDESTVRDLTQLILAWPQEGKSARAASGLNILTRIGSDMALLQLHHISQRAKSRPLRDSAEQYLEEVADARGLSEEQLQDRLTPTLGLDDAQALTFDFGTRSFSVRFDENLLPVIYDQQGARQKTIPRLRADDDQVKAAEALARLKGLKKDATQVAKRLLPHLENALRLARSWNRAEFQALFVDHPLTSHLTRRLVWGVYAPNEPRRLLNAFRVAAEGEFCDSLDETIALPEDAVFGIAHPLEMGDKTCAAFEQILNDYLLLQPFRQLARRTVLLTPAEAASSKLTRWQGKSTTCGQLLGIRGRGWWQANENCFYYDLPQHRLILEVSPGFVHYNIDAKASQQFGTITLYRDERPAAFSQLDSQDLSEALSTVDIIFR